MTRPMRRMWAEPHPYAIVWGNVMYWELDAALDTYSQQPVPCYWRWLMMVTRDANKENHHAR